MIRRGSKEADSLLDHLIMLREMNRKPDQEIFIRNTLSAAWLLLLEEIKKHFEVPKTTDSEKFNLLFHR